jgi:predicted metal-binding membrane protein
VNGSTREALPGWIALLLVAALAWQWTLTDAAAMGNAPGTMGMPFGPFLAMWLPMMTAMMLPAIAPVATVWVRCVARQAGALHRMSRLALFGLGYLVVWTSAGVAAFALMRPVEIGIDRGLYSAQSASAAVFALAGLYQLSALREACLSKCRSPATVLGLATAGPAPLRDLRAGALHGAWCLACCWSLMAVLALVGLMNVAAMAILAAFIFAEKTTRFGVPAGRLAGLVMLAAAAVSLAGVPIH